MPNPHFLLVEIAGEYRCQERLLADIAGQAKQAGAQLLACAASGFVAGLEPGTVASGIVLAKYADLPSLRASVRTTILPQLQRSLPKQTVPVILAVEGLPEAGLPDMMDVPTVASVPRPPSTPRNTFFIVRGSAWDQQRLNAYRDAILPMHKERGGFYEVFALQPEQVETFSGTWGEQIFAVSRWPQRSAALDFWYCDRYQNEAIPLRLGAGRFTVHMLDAVATS